MLKKLYLAWGVLICGWLMTADTLGWKSPSLTPRGHTGSSTNWYFFGVPSGGGSRGSGGSFGWGGGK
jgi:hypothetical protein